MSGPGRALFGEAELANVAEAMAGTLVRYRYGTTDDPTFVYRFERSAEELFGAAHCLATNSCTSALLVALGALGVGPGDEVIVPGYTFIASIAAVVLAGATPVLAEIDETLNLDPVDAAAKITPNTRAIIAVHMLGAGADLDRLQVLAGKHDLALIEDVAQACGGSVGGRRLGSIGDCGAFSLNYFKVITSGEGGFLLTSHEEVYRRAYALHDHGFMPMRGEAVDDDSMFGLNVRMGDLSGALALAQLGKLDDILARTRSVKRRLVEAIGPLPGVNRRRLVDPAGDCALVLAYIFADQDSANEVARLLNTKTLLSSGRHYYGNMGQLCRMAELAGSRPFHRDGWDRMPSYPIGSLPATDSMLARTVALSTGSADAYSATGFGVNVHSEDDDIARVAERFRSAVQKMHG